MNGKKIRNPFPAVAKVFKYEMKHSYRILLPVYAMLAVVSLLVGLLVIDSDRLIVNDGSVGLPDGVRALFALLCTALFIASFVVTVLLLNRRFKGGLLGDEAYLNLSLPVTMGEHVWGRALAALVWSAGYVVAVGISVLLMLVRFWQDIPSFFAQGTDVLQVVGQLLACCLWAVTVFMLVIMLEFCVNAIGHLAKKGRTVIQLIAAVVLITVIGRIYGSVVQDSGQLSGLVRVALSSSALNAVFIVLLGVATQLILQFRLNLE